MSKPKPPVVHLPLILPKDYRARLPLRETERAIKWIKDHFQSNLSDALNLERISAPLVVQKKTGINDYLNGWEEPVSFTIREMDETGEIVQSLAKWKRKALGDYGFNPCEGLYTDMNAIRPDESLDNLHSLYVDQWDWERVITRDERHIDFLKSIVRKIYQAFRVTEETICLHYQALGAPLLPDEITFIHSEELLQMYPDKTPKEREDAICQKHGAVFVLGIGAQLADGQPHDGRAADYDDWSTETGGGKKGLNGDILVWNPVLNRAFEISSMGIRVDADSLRRQVAITGELEKLDQDFHKLILDDTLPLTIGGGIGQSRLCMFFLRSAHIGEIQASVWPEGMRETCRESNIILL